MRIREIISTPVRTVRPEASAREAWEAMHLYRTRHLVVTDEEGHVVGIIAASDLGGTHGDALRSSRRVGELMTENVVTAELDTTVREAANVMRSSHQLPARDEGAPVEGDRHDP